MGASNAQTDRLGRAVRPEFTLGDGEVPPRATRNPAAAAPLDGTEQTRLADPRLAGQEGEPAPATTRGLEPFVGEIAELVAAHEGRADQRCVSVHLLASLGRLRSASSAG